MNSKRDNTNKPIQQILFSATFNNNVIKEIKQLFNNPNEILMKKDDLTLEGVQQLYIECNRNKKMDKITEIYEVMSISSCVIFVNTKVMGEKLVGHLQKLGHSTIQLSSNLDNKERDHAMENFLTGQCKVLITTNLLSRGFDQDKINLIINFDLPSIYMTDKIDLHT